MSEALHSSGSLRAECCMQSVTCEALHAAQRYVRKIPVPAKRNIRSVLHRDIATRYTRMRYVRNVTCEALYVKRCMRNINTRSDTCKSFHAVRLFSVKRFRASRLYYATLPSESFHAKRCIRIVTGEAFHANRCKLQAKRSEWKPRLKEPLL